LFRPSPIQGTKAILEELNPSTPSLSSRLLLSNLALVISLALAVIGWLLAFIGTAAAEADKLQHQGVLWFGVFLELFLILGVILTLGTDSIGMARLQLSAFLAVALVFSVFGINAGIYGGPSSQKASAAGFFILTIVNVIWLAFFTSEDGSPFFNFISSFGGGQLSGGGRFGSNNNGGISAGGIGAPSVRNGNASTGYGNGGAFGGGSNSVGGSYQPAYGSSPSAVDIHAPSSGSAVGKTTAPSMRSNTIGNGNTARSHTGHGNGSVVGAGSEIHSPISRPGGATLDGQSTNGDAIPDYGYRARALYACECS